MRWREKEKAAKGEKGKCTLCELGGCRSWWSLAEEAPVSGEGQDPARSLKHRAQGSSRSSEVNYHVCSLFSAQFMGLGLGINWKAVKSWKQILGTDVLCFLVLLAKICQQVTTNGF